MDSFATSPVAPSTYSRHCPRNTRNPKPETEEPTTESTEHTEFPTETPRAGPRTTDYGLRTTDHRQPTRKHGRARGPTTDNRTPFLTRPRITRMGADRTEAQDPSPLRALRTLSPHRDSVPPTSRREPKTGLTQRRTRQQGIAARETHERGTEPTRRLRLTHRIRPSVGRWFRRS